MNTFDLIFVINVFISLLIIVYIAWIFYCLALLIKKYPKIMASIFGWIFVIGIVGYVGYETNHEESKITVTEWQESNNEWTYIVTSTEGGWTTSPSDDVKKIELLADGACVDKAQTILNILKRRYNNYDQIRVADSPEHVQTVRLNDDGTIDFLDLVGVNVIVGKNEFDDWDINNGKFRLIDPEQFLAAIDIYKPSINNYQLNSYLSKINERK